MTTKPSKNHDNFENPNPEKDYLICKEIPDFSFICHKTGQHDFANISLYYVPDSKCIELKALKLYVWSYRDVGAFHEAVTNKILDDIVHICEPRYALVTARFNVRGGTYPTIKVQHRLSNWEPIDPSIIPRN